MKVQLLALVACALPVASIAQTAVQVPIHISETGGMRRSQFPVNARVPFPRGALKDATHVRLLQGTTEIPLQTLIESAWPDGSIQWLSVDLNATIGAMESQTYMLEYGDTVTATAAARGLTVVEDAEGIQVGNIRLGKSGWPLIPSVKYRDEAVASGANGLVVTDASGGVHDLSTAQGVKAEVVKRGPLVVAVRYSGTLRLDGTATAPFQLTVELPNSKSWVKLAARVSDPGRRVREIALATPLSLGPAPWVWDFGTPRWTYGAMRMPADSVVMTDTVRSSTSAEWTVSNGPKGREQVYETSRADGGAFAGWGHVQGAKEVVAWAIERVSAHVGIYRIALDGAGQTSFSFAPAAAASEHDLVLYEHFVSTPVQIGAATSPAAILSPLIASCDAAQYVKAGVAAP